MNTGSLELITTNQDMSVDFLNVPVIPGTKYNFVIVAENIEGENIVAINDTSG